MSNQNSTTPIPPQTSSFKEWNVILYNRDGYDLYVTDIIASLIHWVKMDELTALRKAVEWKIERETIVATTHKEHAELLQEQLLRDGHLCQIEPA